MSNVGWWKCLGSFALCIPRVKGDFEIWLKTFFITSFPTPLREAGRALAFPLVKILILTGEGFAWWSSRSLSVYSIFFIIGRDHQSWKGTASVLPDKFAFPNHQSLVAWLFHYLAHELHDPSFENCSYPCGRCACCLFDNFPDLFDAQNWEIHPADKHWLIPPSADLFDVDLIPS